AVAVQHLLVGCRVLHIEVFPHGLVEVLEVLHGPFPKRRVAVENKTFLGLQPTLVIGDAGLGDTRGVRCPQRGGLIAAHMLSQATDERRNRSRSMTMSLLSRSSPVRTHRTGNR